MHFFFSCCQVLPFSSSLHPTVGPLPLLCPHSIFLLVPISCRRKIKGASLHAFSDRDHFKCNGTFFLNCAFFFSSFSPSWSPVPLFLCLCLTVPSCHWAHLLHPAVNYGGGLQTGMQLRVQLTHWPTLVMSFPSHWSKSQSHSSLEFSQLIYSSLPPPLLCPESRYFELCKAFPCIYDKKK